MALARGEGGAREAVHRWIRKDLRDTIYPGRPRPLRAPRGESGASGCQAVGRARMSDDTVLDALRQCAAEIGQLPKIKEYDSFRAANRGAPSVATIFAATGSWSAALEATTGEAVPAETVVGNGRAKSRDPNALVSVFLRSQWDVIQAIDAVAVFRGESRTKAVVAALEALVRQTFARELAWGEDVLMRGSTRLGSRMCGGVC